MVFFIGSMFAQCFRELTPSLIFTLHSGNWLPYQLPYDGWAGHLGWIWDKLRPTNESVRMFPGEIKWGKGTPPGLPGMGSTFLVVAQIERHHRRNRAAFTCLPHSLIANASTILLPQALQPFNRPKTSSSSGILEAFRARLEPLRYPTLWTEQLPGFRVSPLYKQLLLDIQTV